MNIELDREQIGHIIFALQLVENQALERFKEEGKRESPCDACPSIIDKLSRSIGQNGYSGWHNQPMETA